MKKIVFFTSRFPFKTVGENFFESELEGVSKKFDEVYIIACNGAEKNSTIKKKLPNNVKAIKLKRKRSILDLFFGVIRLPFCELFYREIGQIMKEKKPFFASIKTLIYSGSYYLAICDLLKSAAKEIPVSKDDEVLVSGYWLNYIAAAALKFKKYIPLDNVSVVSRAHGSADIINLIRPNKFYPFQEYVLKNLDGVLAISDSGMNYLKSISPRPQIITRTYIGSYGPDSFAEHRRKPFTVMTCANFFAYKRIDIVADAIHYLIKEIPDIRWVHFGDGPLRDSIERKCADITDNIDFRGNMPHDELLKYLESGEPSLFVSASASEGLPVSVMEAIAYSVPAVATDVNGTREAVITGISGTLLPMEITGETLAKTILVYYHMTCEEYNCICRSSYELWKKHFDCKKNSDLLSEKLISFLN